MSKSIAIFDYGIGGLGVYSYLKKLNYEGSIVYFSDAGFTPYGQLSSSTLKDRLITIFDFLQSQGIEKVAVACNAASSVLPVNENLVELSIIDFGIREALKSNYKNIAVWAGGRTIESCLYKNALEVDGRQVSQHITQFFSLRIEKGDIGSEELKLFAKSILKKCKPAEAILLACTHYPAIVPLLKAIDSQRVYLDPAMLMAQFICDNWNSAEKSEDEFYTTGSLEIMKKASKNAFGVQLKNISQVSFQ